MVDQLERSIEDEHQNVFTWGIFFRRAWPGCREPLPGSGSSFLCKPKHKQSESLWVFWKTCSSFGLLFTEALQLTLLIIFCYDVDRVDKKRDKIERKILDSQERAFWDVHRPVVSRRANPSWMLNCEGCPKEAGGEGCDSPIIFPKAVVN